MKFKKIKLKHLVSSFLSIMESDKVIHLSLPSCCLSMLLGLSESLSYYFKLRFYLFTDSKLIFFKNMIFYSNFSNVLFYLKSPLLTLIIFISVQTMVYVFMFYLFFIILIRRLNLFKIENSKIIVLLNYLFQCFVSLYYWVLFVPILELYSNILDCNWYSYFDDFNDNCSSHVTSLSILSVFGIISTIISGFFILWLYRTYTFIETGLLKKKFTVIIAILYISKILLVLLYPLINENMTILIFLLLHIIGLYSLFDYIKNFPITNSILSKFYISVLISYEMVCTILTIYEYTDLIEEQSLFYILAIVIVFSIKIGLKIFEYIYHNQLKSNMEDEQFIGYCLEEFFRLFYSRHSCNKDSFFLGGILKLHVSKCKFSKCILKEDILRQFELISLEEQQKLINNFITQMFTKTIHDINKKKGSNTKNFELSVLKFSSFLNKNNTSPMRAFYQIQKVFSLNHSKSFYFQSISINILRQIIALIGVYEAKSHRNSDSTVVNEKELDVKIFFEMFNEKILLKKLFLVILERRVHFWDKYKDGFRSYEEILKDLNFFMNSVIEVRQILETNLLKNRHHPKKIFDLKFRTILECIIFNNVNSAVKTEDELDKLKKKELTLEKKILNINSFFYGNYTTVHASFLNSHGKILESSKKESLATFFKYSMEEVKALNEIKHLMPAFISNHHSKFINWYMKKEKTSETKTNRFISSFALDKQGFIFPIRIHVGFNFDSFYDVVFNAALVDLGKREENLMIFDQNGQILGMTYEFHRLFGRESSTTNVEVFLLFNIFNFIPNLKNIIEKLNIFEDKDKKSIVNQVTQMNFPENLEEIIDIFILKMKENNNSHERSSKSFKSGVLVKSIKSMKSEKSSTSHHNNRQKTKSSKFLTKFLQTWNRTSDEKLEIELKFQDKELTNFDLMELLIDQSSCRKHKINFNLNIVRHYYSKSDCLTIGVLSINKISKDLKRFSVHPNKFDTFYDPKLSIPSEVIEKLTEFEIEQISQQEDDDIKSSFVLMPDLNEPIFKAKDEKSILAAPNNRLMTTEIDELPPIKEEESKTAKSVCILESAKNANKEVYPKIEEIKINKTPPPDSFINSSDYSDIKKQNIHGNTSNQRVIDVIERSSQKSSISNVKKTFTVFTIINLIQRSIPSCLSTFSFSQTLGLIIIICYCIAIYVMSVQYIENNYNPLNEGVINFAKMYNTYTCTNLVTVEYEYAIYNYSDYLNGFTYDKEFKAIILESFTTLKDINNLERSKPTTFEYQNFFKNAMINASNYLLPIMQEMSFIEFLDNINGQLFKLQQKNFTDMTLAELEYFSTNFINFLNIYQKISNSLDSEFFQTNESISTVLEILMILFVISIVILKCFEYCQLDLFLSKMIKILNIFLRVNQKEAFGELLLTKDIQNVVKNQMDTFLNYNYIDKVLTKKEFQVSELDEDENAKRTNRDKKLNMKKKLSFQDLRPLSRFPMLMFLFICGFLILIYIGLNYYYFVFINGEIKNLITITIFFEKIYTLPTTVLMINRVILRERVLTNRLYNFPDLKTRQMELNAELKNYVDDFYSATDSISAHSLKAIDSINDKSFSLIIYGDACEALLLEGLIQESDMIKCQTCLNNAFQKGLLSIANELLNGVNSDDVNRVIYNDTTSIEEQKQSILTRMKNNVGADRVMANYFLNKLLMVFYNDLETFYKDEMLIQIGNLKVVILITTIFLGLGLSIEIYMSKKYYEKAYKNVSMSLNLIPYEKLLNDEQTLFLIKRYWRD